MTEPNFVGSLHVCLSHVACKCSSSCFGHHGKFKTIPATNFVVQVATDLRTYFKDTTCRNKSPFDWINHNTEGRGFLLNIDIDSHCYQKHVFEKN